LWSCSGPTLAKSASPLDDKCAPLLATHATVASNPPIVCTVLNNEKRRHNAAASCSERGSVREQLPMVCFECSRMIESAHPYHAHRFGLHIYSERESSTRLNANDCRRSLLSEYDAKCGKKVRLTGASRCLSAPAIRRIKSMARQILRGSKTYVPSRTAVWRTCTK
jgi:hypothetical protein